MSLAQVASGLDAFADDLRRAPASLARVGGQTVLEAALRYSHGPFSTAYLSGFKPGLYSKRMPRPPQHTGIVNRQSGLFASSWQQSVDVGPGEIVLSTFNTAPYAASLEDGTRTAIRRPLPDLVVKTTMALLAQRAVSALPQFLNP